MPLPADAARVLGAALVAELTVLGPGGRPISYPLIPLFDGERIYMTSSILFSRKLEHIKADPKVAVSVSDPSALVHGVASLHPVDDFVPITVQGDARVLEDDLHAGWMSLLPLWEAKEPVIRKFVRQRFGLPLFFERSVIEIVPRRVYVWRDGATGIVDIEEPVRA